MPSSFPFFRLPILIQFLILKHLGLLELFYLSLVSKRSKHIVKSLNLTQSKLCWDLVPSPARIIKLGAPNGTGLDSRFHTSDMIMAPSAQINVNGIIVPVVVSQEPNGSRVYLDIQTTSEKESWGLLDKFTESYLKLFKVSRYVARLPVVLNLHSWFLWKYTKRFEKMRVTDCQDTRPPRQLTSDDMKFVLEELTIDDVLDIRASVEEGFQYSGSLKMRELCVKKGDWLTLEAILNMDCEQLYFPCATITYQDLNAIIKKWLAGGLKNLEHLILYRTPQLEQQSVNTKLERVFEGIEHFPWNPNNRPQNAIVDFMSIRIRFNYNFRNGRDIRRRDGTIATVDFLYNPFVFHIWNHLSVNQ